VRLLQAVGTTAAIALLATGCASADDWSQPRAAAPTPIGALGAGFVPSVKPSPEATITPRRGSWDGVHPPKDYRVVLLTAGDDPQTTTLVTAVEAWATQEHVSLKTVNGSGDHIARIGAAMDLQPDVIVAAGNDLVDPLAMVTPNHLDQQFLVLGAELAEPTGNVTAADWTGASFRGEGLGASSAYDPTTFTPARAAAAIRAGSASVLTGHTGIVIWLP
jgi:hypothetical protein